MADDWIDGDGGWSDGLPVGGDAWPAGEWGDGLPLGPAHGAPAPPGPASWIAEILLDGEVIWSSATSAAQQTLTVDVSSYTGTKTLKFRLRRTA